MKTTDRRFSTTARKGEKALWPANTKCGTGREKIAENQLTQELRTEIKLVSVLATGAQSCPTLPSDCAQGCSLAGSFPVTWDSPGRNAREVACMPHLCWIPGRDQTQVSPRCRQVKKHRPGHAGRAAIKKPDFIVGRIISLEVRRFIISNKYNTFIY